MGNDQQHPSLSSYGTISRPEPPWCDWEQHHPNTNDAYTDDVDIYVRPSDCDIKQMVRYTEKI